MLLIVALCGAAAVAGAPSNSGAGALPWKGEREEGADKSAALQLQLQMPGAVANGWRPTVEEARAAAQRRPATHASQGLSLIHISEPTRPY